MAQIVENGLPSRPSRENRLNIDNVVSSHPELGPTPPDGGYGWIIVLGAIAVQVTVPSILCAYGVILLYLNLLVEYDENQVFKIWDKNIILVPIFMTVFWLLLEPWSRTIVLISNRPRVVSISGVFLMGAGIMLSNFSAESDENDVAINAFSGILIGTGASLTTQQTEILLKHFFRKKIDIVQKIYKTSIVFGYIVIPLIMGIFCTHFGASTSLVIYAGFVLQQCFTLLLFNRPTYVVKALSKNYKILRELNEDDDEEIYSSRVEVRTSERRAQSENATNNNNNDNKQEETNVDQHEVEDDDPDENVIGTFNSANTTRVIESHSPVLARYETTNNPFGSNFVSEWDRIDRFVEPQDLYRETTIAADAAGDNVFTYEPPGSTSPGTARRTANTKKNFIILLSVLKDKKFYAFTHIQLSYKFTMLVFLVLFPAYVSQMAPDMEMLTVISVVTVMQIGAMGFTIVLAFFSTIVNEKYIIRFFSILAMISLEVMCKMYSSNWRMFFGMLVMISTNIIYIGQKPIFNNMTLNFDASAVSISSNCICALFILVFMLAHNYYYETCFMVAAGLHFMSAGISFIL